MNFDLTTPCKHCPFRKGANYLSKERACEIANGLKEDKTFTCHEKTHSLGWSRQKKEQHCAGATIVLENEENSNQMMRIMERLGLYDRKKLKRTHVVKGLDEFIENHGG